MEQLNLFDGMYLDKTSIHTYQKGAHIKGKGGFSGVVKFVNPAHRYLVAIDDEDGYEYLFKPEEGTITLSGAKL